MPLLQRALQSIARDSERRKGAPHLLVLAPTAEHADHIRAVYDLKQWFATKVRSRNSGFDLTSLQAIVLEEVDVLIIEGMFAPQL
jgi:phosphoribosyl 1,2-cyclic phosphodiesterase